MRSVLITRPLDSAQLLARRLTPLGYNCVIEPLLTIEALHAPCPDLADVAAVMITSHNAATLLPADAPAILKSLPCFCVGANTSAAAQSAGFLHIHHSAGDGHDLAQLVKAQSSGMAKTILHIAARDYDSAAPQTLRESGFTVIAWTIYQAIAATELGIATQQLLRQGAIDAALFYSARTAHIFRQLAQRHDATDGCRAMLALGLSQNVVTVLNPLPWRQLAAPAAPNEDAMIDCLTHHLPVTL